MRANSAPLDPLLNSLDRPHPTINENADGYGTRWHFAAGDPDFPLDSVDGDERAPLGSAHQEFLFKRARKRQSTQAIGAALCEIGREERGNRCLNCGIRFTVDHYQRGRVVRQAWYCRDLCCELCGERLARERQRDANARVEAFLEKNPGLQGIFLTLTSRSCSPVELKAHVANFMAALPKFLRRAKVRRAIVAWLRAYELTWNAGKQTFHFHAHLVLFVDRETYFAPNSPTYQTQKAWAKEWRGALGVDYQPVVDVRATTISSPLDEAGRKALLEAVKYTFKPGSIVTRMDGAAQVHGENELIPYDCGDGLGVRPVRYAPLRAIVDALKNKRMVAFSANLPPPEEDADFTDAPEVEAEAGRDLGEFVCREIYTWKSKGRGGGAYRLVARVFDLNEGREAMPP